MSLSRFHKALTPVDMAGIAGVIVVAVVAHFGGFEPVRRARAEHALQRDQLAALSQSHDANTSSIRTQKTALGEMQHSEESTVRLEHASRLNSRMAAIPELADRCAVRVREVVPKTSQPGKRFTRVPITIAGEGPAPRISVFLSQLHSEFPDMEVVSFAIAGRADTQSEAAHFSMELLWYTLAGSDGSAAAPAKASPPAP